MYEIIAANQFKKDYKKCIKRNFKIELLDKAVLKMAELGTLPQTYKPHILSGSYAGYWECHIKSDWLLLWLQNESDKTIYLARTGTHSDLF